MTTAIYRAGRRGCEDTAVADMLLRNLSESCEHSLPRSMLAGTRSTHEPKSLLIEAQNAAGLDVWISEIKPLDNRLRCNEMALVNPGDFNDRQEYLFAGQTAVALLATPIECR